MQTTIFDTRFYSWFLHGFAIRVLAWIGWKVVGDIPRLPKCVLVFAPHTSNWDFFLGLLMCFAVRLKIYWMGKHSMFRPPVGGLMRWLGGIAIDRAHGGNVVQASIDAFNKHEQLAIGLAPEGTRSKVTHWKTGFYRIAHGAGVPIVLCYLDYPSKTGGIGGVFITTGDMEADIAAIQSFYKDIRGKHPQ